MFYCKIHHSKISYETTPGIRVLYFPCPHKWRYRWRRSFVFPAKWRLFSSNFVLFLKHSYLCTKKKKITRWLEHMNRKSTSGKLVWAASVFLKKQFSNKNCKFYTVKKREYLLTFRTLVLRRSSLLRRRTNVQNVSMYSLFFTVYNLHFYY